MNNRTKRIATAIAVGGVVAGGLLATAGPASAMPSDTPCGASDVRVAVTLDPEHASGHEAYLLSYTAASSGTNCKLQGAPTALTFVSNGQQITDVSVAADGGASTAAPVHLRVGHPAESRIVQRSAEAPNPLTPTSVSFNLPGGPKDQLVTADWPADAPLKGSLVEVTAVGS